MKKFLLLLGLVGACVPPAMLAGSSTPSYVSGPTCDAHGHAAGDGCECDVGYSGDGVSCTVDPNGPFAPNG
jgi:hypothetical protein